MCNFISAVQRIKSLQTGFSHGKNLFVKAFIHCTADMWVNEIDRRIWKYVSSTKLNWLRGDTGDDLLLMTTTGF